MTQHRLSVALTTSLLLAGLAAAAPALAQDTTITLHTDQDGDQVFDDNCQFTTSKSSVLINLSDSGNSSIEADGTFTGGAGCPTSGGGGPTGQASVNITVTGGDLTPETGNSRTVHWTATADACRFSSFSLPGAKPTNWNHAGYDYACVGADQCAAGDSAGYTFQSAGTYTIQLKCASGPDSTHPTGTVDIATKTFTVEGGGNNPPPSGTCSPPSGFTRLESGKVQSVSGAYTRNNVNLTDFESVFGYQYSTGKMYYWPTYAASEHKLRIAGNRFVALAFQVPSDYAYSPDGWGSFGPYALFYTAGTLADTATWTFSLSTKCGDFPTQAQLDAGTTTMEAVCYQQYGISSNSLGWQVRPAGEMAGNQCTLRRGQTYYLNILPAELGTPTVNTCNTTGGCRVNIKQVGSFEVVEKP